MDMYDITVRQVATSESSSAAMLDPETENRLYHLFRQFYQESEEQRNWNLWTDIPWDAVTTEPSAELVESVLAVMRRDLFLPDYSAKSLHRLRASRGRAWFWTHWSYEEGKHLLTWMEWLTRTGAYTDDSLRQYADEQLIAYRWEPPVDDAAGIFFDTLLWEQQEMAEVEELQRLARTAGDAVLLDALGKIGADEAAHYGFVKSSLQLIREKHEDLIRDAAERIASANERAGGGEALLRLLD